METIYKIPLQITSKDWSLNKIYSGVHHWVRSKDKEYITLLVKSVVMKEHKTFDKKVSIEMAFKSKLDISNHGYLFKLIEDALVKCEVIENDTKKFVGEIKMTSQEEFEGIIVTIREM